MSEPAYDPNLYDPAAVPPGYTYEAMDPLGLTQPTPNYRPTAADRGWTALTMTLRHKLPGHVGWSQRYRRQMAKLGAAGSRIR